MSLMVIVPSTREARYPFEKKRSNCSAKLRARNVTTTIANMIEKYMAVQLKHNQLDYSSFAEPSQTYNQKANKAQNQGD